MEQHKITRAIRTGVDRTNEMEHSAPLFLTSSFCFDDAENMRAAFADETDDNIYSRFSNPNVQELVDKICILEGAAAGFATASGMSAIFASFMALLKQGDHLLCCNAIFGSTHTVISPISFPNALAVFSILSFTGASKSITSFAAGPTAIFHI